MKQADQSTAAKLAKSSSKAAIWPQVIGVSLYLLQNDFPGVWAASASFARVTWAALMPKGNWSLQAAKVAASRFAAIASNYRKWKALYGDCRASNRRWSTQ